MAKVIHCGTIFLLSSIFFACFKLSDAATFPRAFMNGVDRTMLDEYRERSRLANNEFGDLQPEENAWSLSKGLSRSPETLTWDDTDASNTVGENDMESRADEEKSGFIKVNVRSFNPPSVLRQRENVNPRLAFELLRKKSMKAFVPYPQKKRQILYKQCFFNPISCF